MTGDGVNDALAIKTADIGIAMNSGSPATKAVARLVLLDGQFSHLPDVVAEGRQAIANIERVSMLFLNKTVYATALAIIFGVLVLEFPFLPRQLSITDGLTIGIPAFFLALDAERAALRAGLPATLADFAIPAGIIVASGLTWYNFVANGMGVGQDQLRTGATIILAIVGIWVLAVLARPLNRYKVLVVGAMFVALVGVFTIPLATTFFELVDPGEELTIALTGIIIVMIAGIEIVRLIHRRLVSGLVAPPAPSGRSRRTEPAPGVREPARSSTAAVTVLGYLGGAARDGARDPRAARPLRWREPRRGTRDLPHRRRHHAPGAPGAERGGGTSARERVLSASRDDLVLDPRRAQRPRARGERPVGLGCSDRGIHLGCRRDPAVDASRLPHLRTRSGTRR